MRLYCDLDSQTLTPSLIENVIRNFPGGPGVKTSCSKCRGPAFNP